MSLVQSGTDETKQTNKHTLPDEDPTCIREGQGQVNTSELGCRAGFAAGCDLLVT